MCILKSIKGEGRKLVVETRATLILIGQLSLFSPFV